MVIQVKQGNKNEIKSKKIGIKDPGPALFTAGGICSKAKYQPEKKQPGCYMPYCIYLF